MCEWRRPVCCGNVVVVSLMPVVRCQAPGLSSIYVSNATTAIGSLLDISHLGNGLVDVSRGVPDNNRHFPVLVVVGECN